MVKYSPHESSTAKKDYTQWWQLEVPIKFVDATTGYIHQENIPDRTALTCNQAFLDFQAHAERQTGCKITQVSTDGENEFKKQFGKTLQTHGISQLIGDPHKNHIPMFAERANQSVQKVGRAALHDSLLPLPFYGEAQLWAVWVLNRLVHIGKTNHQ